MANYSTLEFRYARPLARAIVTQPEFRAWLLRRTKVASIARDLCPMPKLQATKRNTKDQKRWYWFNHFCRDTCSCQVEQWLPEDGRRTETDILIIFKEPTGSRIALHIEVKPPGEGWDDKKRKWQAETYRRRAECWATNPEMRPPTVLEHRNFVTLLACGTNLRDDPRNKLFDDYFVHDEIAEQISPYPDLWDHRDKPPKA
jgi:hypothetical protein